MNQPALLDAAGPGARGFGVDRDPHPPRRRRPAGGRRLHRRSFTLCVQNGKFQIQVDWTTPAAGDGRGRASAMTLETGYFWFFSQNNVEVVIKVLDGRTINGHWWVFFGALSDVSATPWW